MPTNSYRIKCGMDLPIAGTPFSNAASADLPKFTIERVTPKSVAVLGADYVGMKPTMRVQVGDRVEAGQTLFCDKRNPEIKYVSPAAGVISLINRGERRVFQSIVVELDSVQPTLPFAQGYHGQDVASYSPEQLKSLLLENGMWPAFRTRPFSQVPVPSDKPSAIFINAMDTNPLAVDPSIVMASEPDAVKKGLELIAALSLQVGADKVFCVTAPDNGVSLPNVSGVEYAHFSGPHPAGLVGTHIHFLNPVSADKSVWHLGIQDVVAIGNLLLTGKNDFERIVSIAGPTVVNPRLVRSLLGSNLSDLTEGQLQAGENRLISGSVLSGFIAASEVNFLGRYHTQLTVLKEGRERLLFEYLWPGAKKHSVMSIFLSKLTGLSQVDFTTSTNGSPRAMVPVGAYEKVMPLDILATQLLRSLITGDTQLATELGSLELDEEDLALCTYVCPGKYEYGPLLRDVLTRIQLEG